MVNSVLIIVPSLRAEKHVPVISSVCVSYFLHLMPRYTAQKLMKYDPKKYNLTSFLQNPSLFLYTLIKNMVLHYDIFLIRSGNHDVFPPKD